jgi:arginase
MSVNIPIVRGKAAAMPRKRVRFIGVPLDLGASRRGVDMGPSAMRIARLADVLRQIGHEVVDEGNLAVPQREEHATLREQLDAIGAVCSELAMRTANAIRAGDFPLVLGGDHSLAAGSIAGVATAYAERSERIGVIWLDAHGDINTPESSLSGNIHGMPVAHLLGDGDDALSRIASRPPAVRAEHLVYIGLRDLDDAERRVIHEKGITAYTMSDIDERGLPAIVHDAVLQASSGTAGIYLSCDADWVDPSEAPGVGTPVHGGATYREAHLVMEMLADTGLVVGMDLVEINPVLDTVNRTAELAVELIASALGKRTL